MTSPPPGRPRSGRFRSLTWPILIGAGISVILLAALAGSCARIPESGSRQRVLFYSMPVPLTPGSPTDSKRLEERLHRLGYVPVETPSAPGQYRISRSSAEIFLRPFRYPDRKFPGGRVLLHWSSDEIREAQPIDTLSVEDLRLEPERIAGFEGETGALLNPLRLEDAPPLLVDALIAIEDRRFYKHPGIDPVGTARALWANLRRGGVSQGGSTLTQQLARSLYLHNRKTVARKAQEAFLAIGLELRYSKKEILEAYLNAVYWGTWGSMEIRGAREASRYYLGTDIEKADAAGLALLVGIIPAPNAFSPYNNPEKAKYRRDLVLRQLEKKGIVTAQVAKAALAKPLPSKRPPLRPAEASYFLDAVRAEVERRAPKGILQKAGTVVFTTMDPNDQAAAVSALGQGLLDLEKKHRRLRGSKDPLQGAVVTIDPASGEVRALVGGRDFQHHPFNRAIDAHRQPGSLFKPFVYLAAFRHPERKSGDYWTPATIIEDEPLSIRAGRKVWHPMNYDREYRGEVTLRRALEQSLNVPTAAVAQEVGIGRVARAAQDLGIRSPLQEVPSLALGTSEVTLLEITSAYAALAAEGEAKAPTLIRAILDKDGKNVSLHGLEQPPGVDPAEAYLVTRLLQGVIRSGTGRQARSLGVRGSVAGKTGTTDDYRDAWFVGFTPLRATGVWVGFDRKGNVGLSGSAAALPIWAATMRTAEGANGDGNFRRPRGVIQVPIDPETGMLATANCPNFLEEEFLAGTEPTQECDRHEEGILDRLGHIFGF